MITHTEKSQARPLAPNIPKSKTSQDDVVYYVANLRSALTNKSITTDLCVHSRAILSNSALRVVYICIQGRSETDAAKPTSAILGTRASVGLGSISSEEMETSTGPQY